MGVDVDNNGDLLNQLRIERESRDDGASGRHWPWVAAVVVVLLALAAGGWWWWTHSRAVEVGTVTAVAPSASNAPGAVLQATGYVVARRQATVAAQIVGTLTAVLVEEGEYVKQGQVLARIDDTQYVAQLHSAEAQRAVAQAQVAKARATLAQDRANAARMQTMVAAHYVSQQQAEQANTQVAVDQAALDAAVKQVAAAAANITLANVNVGYTVIRAPFAGVVTVKDAEAGQITSPYTAGGGGIATIVDMNSLEVDVDVDETYISRVKPGMPVQAVLDAYPDWTIPAHVIAIIPSADKSKATVKVRIALDKKDPRIIPQMGVRVSFLETAPKPAAQAPRGVLVPATAIVERDGRQVVFVVDGNRAKAVPVTPAQQTYGDMKLLPAGVAAGTEVVAKPSDKLADGTRVKVVGSS